MAANHIFSSSFWKAYWIAVRRARRDPIALKFVLRATLFFIVFGSYYGWLVWVIASTHDGETYFILGLGVSLLIGAFSLIKLWHWKDARTTHREAAELVDVVLRDRLRLEAFALATLLERACSEQMMQTKTLPEGVEVITRRVHLDRLREKGLVDALPDPARDLLLLTDGHWTPQQINACWLSIETLRCLRWVLCIDDTLAPLGDVAIAGGKDVSRFIEKAQNLLKAKRLLDPWDVRVERNTAQAVLSRCFAEQQARGQTPAADEEQKNAVLELHEAARYSPHEDYWVGVLTVVELPDAALSALLLAAYKRLTCLEQVMNLMDGGTWDAFREMIYPTHAEYE